MSGGLIIGIIIFSPVIASSAFDAKFDGLWKFYQMKYRREYGASEERTRRSIWEENAKLVALHNLEADQGLQSYTMELNKFSDKTHEELIRGCLKMSNASKQAMREELYRSKCSKGRPSKLPASVDWRKKGFVTEVKDQKDCGSCWAFSSTGSLEGQVKSKTGHLVSLSEQNLVDCTYKRGDGCEGGEMADAFQYVINNQGIDTEEAYPYDGYGAFCRFKRKGVGANCTSYVKVRAGCEDDLLSAVATIGPIAVAIATTNKFDYYKSGIFHDTSCSQEDLDHAVLVVGYGSKNNKDYWIVKNSWGKDWGMDGYILMARNQHNQCGIASDAVYPIM